MNVSQTTLGSCPVCGTEIPSTRILIEYERTDGPAAYASCPGCRDVVRPGRS